MEGEQVALRSSSGGARGRSRVGSARSIVERLVAVVLSSSPVRCGPLSAVLRDFVGELEAKRRQPEAAAPPHAWKKGETLHWTRCSRALARLAGVTAIS